jgi:hypothetical protein
MAAPLAAQVKGPIVGKAERSDVSKPLRELAEDAKKAEEQRLAELGKGATPEEQAVVDFLKAKHPAAIANGQRKALADADLAKLFPKSHFFALHFRQWPIHFEPPAGLKSGNVCVLTGEKVEILSDAAGLETFFRAHLPEAKNDDDRRAAVRAWLRLAEELHQDGFYQFKKIDDQALRLEGKTASGRAEVEPRGGNQGQIAVELVFDQPSGSPGRFQSAKEQAKLQAGVRPICQATKLLDADPLVRRMAERDILVMGSIARDYLLEQRAKASAELQAAIDATWERIRAEGR